jgi:AraC-like DNA-binding protein
MDALAELRTLIARHGRGGQRKTALANVAIAATTQTTEPVVSMARPAFALVASGVKRTVLGEHTFTYGAGQYLVTSTELPLTGHISRASRQEPFLGFGLLLEPATIATLLLEAGSLDRGIATTAGVAVSTCPADMLDAIVRLMRLLDRPSDLPVLAPMIERELVWRLATGEQGAMVRQIGLADSRLAQIERAIRRIRTHYAEALRIDELMHLAGMSASTFHRHFRAVTTMTPIQYQKQIRLQEARARLIASPSDVAGVGRAVGYDSPSQFSREYHRRFGAPPGKDAERRRAVTTR